MTTMIPPEMGAPQAPPASPTNPLAPQPATPMLPSLEASLSESMAKHSALAEFVRRAEVVRNGLDLLRSKADMVSIDDITSEAATMVSEGADPKIMATVLSTMPTSGNSGELQAWVAAQDAKWTYVEHQLALQRHIAGHDMGVAALRTLAGHELEGGGPQAPAPGVPSNGN